MTSVPCRVVISVQRSDGGNIGNTLGEPAAKAIAAAAESDPALSDLTVTAMIRPAIATHDRQPDVLITEMTVVDVDASMAALKAFQVVWRVLARQGGWDLRRHSVSARPVASKPEPEEWLSARGALADVRDGEPAEVAIRRIRDDW